MKINETLVDILAGMSLMVFFWLCFMAGAASLPPETGKDSEQAYNERGQ